MISKTVLIFFVMLLSGESRPFHNKSVRLTSDSKTVQNFEGVQPFYYPILPFPFQQSSGMFSDFSSFPIRQQFFEMLKKDRKNEIPSRGLFDEDFNERTAQMVDEFGQRVRATVRQLEKAHGQGMEKFGEILEEFKLGEVKDRLKKTLMDKKSLFKKLHSIGWRGKYIGVPYDTTNDDHTIVKKPGVDSTSVSQPNTGVPVLVLVPAIHPNPVQHPALPEVTTSVDFHQESEPTASTDGYVFPITSIPEATENTEISNSIDHTDGLMIIDTTTSKESIIMEEDTGEIPSSETNGYTAEMDAALISVDTSFEVEDEKFTGSTICPEATTEVYANFVTTPSMDTKFQTEAISTLQTTTLDDVILTTEIGPTFPSTFTIVDEEKKGFKIEAYTTATEITLTLGPEETSSSASETTTVPSKRITITDTAYATTARDPETTSDIIFVPSTFPSILSTEEPIATNAVYDLVIDEEPTTETVPSSYPIISTQTTSWPTADSITSVVDVSSTFGYNTSPSFSDAVETSSDIGSTFSVTIPMETTTSKIDREEITEVISTLTEETEIFEEIFTFTTDGERITDIVSTLTSTISPETTSWQSITSGATRPAVETTTGVESTFPSTIPPTEMTERLTGETDTPWEEVSTSSLSDSSTTEVLTTLETVVHDSTIEIDIRNADTISTFPTTIQTQETTSSEGIATATSSLYGGSTIDTGTTTDNLLPLSYSVTTETTMAFDELPTATESQVDNLIIEEGTTEVTTTFPVAVSTEETTTSRFNITTILDVSTRFEDDYLTRRNIDTETTTVVDSTSFATNPIESIAIRTTSLTTVNSGYDSSTIDIQRTSDTASTFQSTISTEKTTTSEEIPATTDSYFDIATIDAEKTTEILLPLSYNVPIETSVAFDELSATTTESSIDSLIIDEGTTEVISTFYGTVPTVTTTTSAPGITTLSYVLRKSDDNYLTSSTIDVESTLPISTDKTTTVEYVSAATDILSYESSTIDEETSTVIIPTETTTSFEDVSEAKYVETADSVTDDGETTTEIVSTFSFTTSTETSVEPASEYDIEARADSGYFERNDIPDLPKFPRSATEEPDVKTLLNLIPLIIDELRKNNLSTREVDTLSQVFGNVWPLLEDESKRKPGELVNHKLAILLLNAGQRLSDTDRRL